MSEAYDLARIASRIEEMRAVSRYRAQETMDQLEEIILYWNDSRARDFARGHEEPMRALVPPLRDRLGHMSAIASAVEPLAHSAESAIRQVWAEQETTRDCAQQCYRHMEAVRYYVAEVHDRSSHCMTVAEDLRRRALALGNPRV